MSKEYSLGSVMNKYAQKVFAHLHAHRVRIVVASLFMLAIFIVRSQAEEDIEWYGYLFVLALVGFYREIWNIFSFVVFAIFFQWRHFATTEKNEVLRLMCGVCGSAPTMRLRLSLTHKEKMRRIEGSSHGGFTAGLGIEADLPEYYVCRDHHPMRGRKKHETFRAVHEVNPEFEIDQVLPLQDE